MCASCTLLPNDMSLFHPVPKGQGGPLLRIQQQKIQVETAPRGANNRPISVGVVTPNGGDCKGITAKMPVKIQV